MNDALRLTTQLEWGGREAFVKQKNVHNYATFKMHVGNSLQCILEAHVYPQPKFGAQDW